MIFRSGDRVGATGRNLDKLREVYPGVARRGTEEHRSVELDVA
jgi:hypothetical protein